LIDSRCERLEGEQGKASVFPCVLFILVLLSVQADTYNNLIRRIDLSSGTVTTLAGVALSPGSTDGAGPAARFYEPAGVAMDAAGTVAIVVSIGGY
jgi:hypothetical protein